MSKSPSLAPQAGFKSLSASFAELETRRRLDKSAPKMNDALAILCVALSTIIMAYASLFGPVSIVLFYAMWLPRIQHKGRLLVKPTGDVLLALLLPLLAIASASWSQETKQTLYSALEFTSLVLCTVIMSRIVRAHAFVRGLTLGCAVVLAASLISRRHGYDEMSGTVSLIGLFGSKNMVGIFAEIGILASVLSFGIRPRRFLPALFFGVAPCAIFLVSLYMSKSATSVLSLLVTLLALATAYLLTRLPRSFRIVTFGITGLFFLLISAAILGLGGRELILKSFGKDTTLTGRTYLWEEGAKIGMHTPILGVGYGAFWVQGKPKAEELWEKFHVPARAGFHFHSVFVELFVELGAAGVAAIILLLAAACIKSLNAVLRYGMPLEYATALAYSIMFTVRSYVEVDIIGTFTIGPMLFYAVFPRLAAYRREQQQALT